MEDVAASIRLKAEAAAPGLTLEAWLQELAQDASPSSATGKGYTLDELLAGCDATAPLSLEDHAWIDEAASGREVV